MRHSDEDAAAASFAKDEYLVAIKLLLREGDKLLIVKDQWGAWDVPGGRIRRDQFDVPDEQVLREKIDFEIGKAVQYELGDIKTTLRVERHDTGRGRVRIYAVCYEGKYLGGEIDLGEYGVRYEWIDIKTTDLEKYGTDENWIPQLKKYQDEVIGRIES